MCYKGIYGKQHRSFVLNLDMSVKRFHVTSRPNLMTMNRIIGKVILVSFKPKIESLIFHYLKLTWAITKNDSKFHSLQ